MIGFFTTTQSGLADRLMADLADRLLAEGRPVLGMVRAEMPVDAPKQGPEQGMCEMYLRLLPEGRIHGITQDLGPGAEGCTLDAGALEEAVMAVGQGLEGAAPETLVLFNKFGKQEAEGRGCRDLIAEAVARGHRVLISAPPQTRAEFLAFAGEYATELPPEPGALAAFAFANL